MQMIELVPIGRNATMRKTYAQQERLRAAAPELAEALRELLAIGKGGVIERRETGKPTWNALDAVVNIARAALEKAGVLE